MSHWLSYASAAQGHPHLPANNFLAERCRKLSELCGQSGTVRLPRGLRWGLRAALMPRAAWGALREPESTS